MKGRAKVKARRREARAVAAMKSHKRAAPKPFRFNAEIQRVLGSRAGRRFTQELA